MNTQEEKHTSIKKSEELYHQTDDFASSSESYEIASQSVILPSFFEKINTSLLRNHSSSQSVTSESHSWDDFFSAADHLSVSSELEIISIKDETISNDIDVCSTTPSIPHSQEPSIIKKSMFDVIEDNTSVKALIAEEQTDVISKIHVQSNFFPTHSDGIHESMTLEIPPSQQRTPHFDMADHMYESAKSVWTFGKRIRVFKPFMGIAEGVAAKAIHVTTGIDDFASADTYIRSHLHGIDKDLVDPTIRKVWNFITPILGRGDDVLQSLVGAASMKIVGRENGN